MKIYDMHVHTNNSDGNLSVKEILDKAYQMGLGGVSITDHDTVDGISEAIKYSKNLSNFTVIPGIELGSHHNGDEVHILGYFIDYENDYLNKSLEELNKWRFWRGEKMIEKFHKKGINLDKERLLEKGDFIGRVAIAKELKKLGYVKTINEAFDKYIGNGKPFYVRKNTYDIEYMIDMIKRAGGVAVLAHPVLLRNDSTINYCIEKGIDGIECYHSKQRKDDTLKYLKIAKENNLVITGGSDCHGRNIDQGLLLGKYYIEENYLRKIKVISNDRK